jgi:hypothetical protein
LIRKNRVYSALVLVTVNRATKDQIIFFLKIGQFRQNLISSGVVPFIFYPPAAFSLGIVHNLLVKRFAIGILNAKEIQSHEFVVDPVREHDPGGAQNENIQIALDKHSVGIGKLSQSNVFAN